MSLDDPELLEREYSSSDRLERRRHNAIGWVRGEEPWVEALAAVAEMRPRRVLDAGDGDGVFLPDVEAGVSELARVLRSGGRFVGIYNRDRHMEELWARLHPASAEGDDYHDVLARHFARVEERDTEAYTLWQTRDDLQAFLDASVELVGLLQAPAGPYPFIVTRRNRVYAAEKAS